MNSLYCWAMNGYLPYGGFKWLKILDNFEVTDRILNLFTFFLRKDFKRKKSTKTQNKRLSPS